MFRSTHNGQVAERSLKHGAEIKREFGAVEQVAELDDLTKREAMRQLVSGRFQHPEITLIRQIEQHGPDVYLIDFAPESREVMHFELNLNIAKPNNDSVGEITLIR